MRNYFRNYLEEIRFKIGGFGVWGNALRILREQAFFVAHSILPYLKHVSSQIWWHVSCQNFMTALSTQKVIVQARN